MKKATRIMNTLGICLGGFFILYAMVSLTAVETDVEAGLAMFWFITAGYLLALAIVSRVQAD